MGRFTFLVKYTGRGQSGTGTDPYRTSCSCIARVADFLGIRDRVYTPSEGDVAERAGYTRSYTKADGTVGSVEVPAGSKVYLANDRAGAKKVQLVTGARTQNGNKRTLSFTFPSFLSVAQIADALGELIPSGKIATTATVGAGEIEPFFSIVGGRTYPIIASAVATATTTTEVATTEPQQATIVVGTKSRKKRRATT
jgi:hypothetical protein